MARGIGRITRTPREATRDRRNAQRLGGAASLMFGGVLTIDGSGTIVLSYGTGLQDDGGILKTKDAEIVHDNLSGYVANEHIDHTSVTITTGVGISGGGDISANRTFDLDILNLTTDTIAAGDWVPFHDLADEANKIAFSDFEATLAHNNLAGYVGNEHIDWTGATQNLLTTGNITIDSDASGIIFGDAQDATLKWDDANSRMILNAALDLGSGSGYGFVADIFSSAVNNAWYFDTTADPWVLNVVGLTVAGVFASSNSGNWDDAHTHISSDGTDHGHIDQDVQTTASPTFANVTTAGTISNAADDSKHTWGADGATDSYVQFGGANLEIYCSGDINIDMAGGNVNFQPTTGGSVVSVISLDSSAIMAVDTRAGTNDKYCYYLFQENGVNKYGYIYVQSNEDFYFYDYTNSKVFLYYDRSDPELELGLRGGGGTLKFWGDVNFQAYKQTSAGPHVETPDEIIATSGGVAASITTVNTEVTTNGDSDLDNVTLANGTSGQVKRIYCVVEGNAADTWKITPANMVGGTQITFSGAGEGCILVYANNEGWVVVANNGGIIS